MSEAGAWSLPIPIPYAAGGAPVADERQRVGAFPDDPVYRGFAVSDILPEEFRTTEDTWAGAESICDNSSLTTKTNRAFSGP